VITVIGDYFMWRIKSIYVCVCVHQAARRAGSSLGLSAIADTAFVHCRRQSSAGDFERTNQRVGHGDTKTVQVTSLRRTLPFFLTRIIR